MSTPQESSFKTRGFISEPVRQAILKAHECSCVYCNATATDIDHVIPVNPRRQDYERISSYNLDRYFSGNPDCLDNLLPACEPCNIKKSNKLLSQSHCEYLLSLAKEKKSRVLEILGWSEAQAQDRSKRFQVVSRVNFRNSIQDEFNRIGLNRDTFFQYYDFEQASSRTISFWLAGKKIPPIEIAESFLGFLKDIPRFSFEARKNLSVDIHAELKRCGLSLPELFKFYGFQSVTGSHVRQWLSERHLPPSRLSNGFLSAVRKIPTFVSADSSEVKRAITLYNFIRDDTKGFKKHLIYEACHQTYKDSPITREKDREEIECFIRGISCGYADHRVISDRVCKKVLSLLERVADKVTPLSSNRDLICLSSEEIQRISGLVKRHDDLIKGRSPYLPDVIGFPKWLERRYDQRELLTITSDAFKASHDYFSASYNTPLYFSGFSIIEANQLIRGKVDKVPKCNLEHFLSVLNNSISYQEAINNKDIDAMVHYNVMRGHFHHSPLSINADNYPVLRSMRDTSYAIRA